jgi:hypothetical protein
MKAKFLGIVAAVALLLTGSLCGPVFAATTSWVGTISSNSSVQLFYTGTIPASYFATADVFATGLPGSNCFYQTCGFPGTFFTSWTVSTSVTIDNNVFSVSRSNCRSPDTCATEPLFGGSTGGDLSSSLFTISVGDIFALCTTFANGTSSQSCFGPKPGDVSLTLNIFNADGVLDLAPIPLPAALSLFATGLAVLASFGWWRKRKSA